MKLPWFWWVKVGATIALLLYSCEALFTKWIPPIPLWIGQVVAVTFFILYMWNYIVLKRQVRKVQDPLTLVTSGGLWGLVRHPMYLADLLWTFGIALMISDWIGYLLWLIIAAAVVSTARDEDRFLAARFPGEHAKWRNHTKLLIPFIY